MKSKISLIRNLLLSFAFIIFLFPFANAKSGSLVMIGGAWKDNLYGNEIMQKFIELAGGVENAYIGIITTASADPVACYDDGIYYERRFARYGVRAKWIPIYFNPEYNQTLENDPYHIAENYYLAMNSNVELIRQVEQMTGFFFGGGDQDRHLRCLVRNDHSDSPLLAAIRNKLMNGAVIAGSSAGTAIMPGGNCLTPNVDWKIYTYKEPAPGLPGDIVNVIAIDSQNNKWIGTDAGLSKFDGNNFINVEGKEIRSIVIDSEGFIWLGTLGDGLIKIRGVNNDGTYIDPVYYNVSNSQLPDNNVKAIAIDNQGNKWIGTKNGLAKFNGTNWTIYNTSNGLPDNEVLSIAIENKNGNQIIWVGFYGNDENGLARYDVNANTWQSYPYPSSGIPDYTVYAIAIDNNGVKWLATYEGLVRYDDNSWNLYYPGKKKIYAVTIDSQGRKWLGTRLGLALFNDSNGSFTFYNTSNSGISDNYVYGITIDSNGNKWIGTGKGLSFFDGTNWTVYRGIVLPDLPDNHITSSAIENVNNKEYFWIGTPKGLTKFDGRVWVPLNPALDTTMPDSFIVSLAIDNNHVKWVGTKRGLAKYNDVEWKLYFPSGVSDSTVNAVAIDSDQNKWIATNQGLHKLTGTSWQSFTTSNCQIPDNVVNAIFIENSIKWIGTNSGLAKYDGTSWTIYLENKKINDIIKKESGDYFVATNNGLFRFNGTNWTSYDTTNSSLPTNVITKVKILGNDIWIGTTNGLVKYNGSVWKIYNSSNSELPNNVITSINIDAKGNKWIGTLGGFVMLKESKNPTKEVPMIMGGETYRSFIDNSYPHYMTDADLLQYNPKGGFSFFPYGILDTHFSNRGRQGRLVRLLSETNTDMGFGVDENTALVIHNVATDSVYMEVLGARGVGIFDISQAEEVGVGNYWGINNVGVTYLTRGDRFYPLTKEVTYAPWKNLLRSTRDTLYSSNDIFSSSYNPHPHYQDSFFPEFVLVSMKHFESKYDTTYAFTFESRPKFKVTFIKDPYWAYKGYMGYAPDDGYDYWSYENLKMNIQANINKNEAPKYLLKNFPNPFNPATNIEFYTYHDTKITLEIYNVKGELVKVLIDNEYKEKGTHRVYWNGKDKRNNSVSSGIYFYVLKSNGVKVLSEKMLLMK